MTGGETFKLTASVDQASSVNTGVMLATDDKSLELPAHLLLSPNEKSAMIEIATQEVTTAEFATISVSCGDLFQSTIVFIDPPKSK